MEKAKIQENLDKANRMLSTAKKMNMPESAVNKAQSEVDKYTKELAEFKEEAKDEKKAAAKVNKPKVSRPPMKAKKAVKKGAKKVAKKAVKKSAKTSKPKVSRPAKKVKATKSVKVSKAAAKPAKSEKTVTFNGKTYTEKDKEFCEVLLKKWHGRKASMKKASSKFKTKSVSTQIGSGVASAVIKSFKLAESKLHDEIAKNPKVYIAKFKRVSSTVKDLSSALKSLLGNHYKSSQFESAVNVIEKEIDKLKKIKK
jgi:hypothetical protein